MLIDPARQLRCWEKIHAVVTEPIAQCVICIRREIPQDRSLRRFREITFVSNQLREILKVRAYCWIEQIYEICRGALKDSGQFESPECLAAIMTYELEPFFNEHLSDLMLVAVGVSPAERRLLEVDVHRYRSPLVSIVHAKAHTCAQVQEDLLKQWRQKLGTDWADSLCTQQTATNSNHHRTDTQSSMPLRPNRSPLERLTKKTDLSRWLVEANLTDRQEECFSLKFEYGLNVSEIARRLQLHRRTVQGHIEEANRKIQTSTKLQRRRKASDRE